MDRTPEGALKELKDLMRFVEAKRVAGLVSRDERGEIYHEAVNLFIDQAGIYAYNFDEVSAAIARQGIHLMRKKLLELHPDLSDELRNLGGGQER